MPNCLGTLSRKFIIHWSIITRENFIPWVIDISLAKIQEVHVFLLTPTSCGLAPQKSLRFRFVKTGCPLWKAQRNASIQSRHSGFSGRNTQGTELETFCHVLIWIWKRLVDWTVVTFDIWGSGARLREGKGFMAPLSPNPEIGLYSGIFVKRLHFSLFDHFLTI